MSIYNRLDSQLFHRGIFGSIIKSTLRIASQWSKYFDYIQFAQAFILKKFGEVSSCEMRGESKMISDKIWKITTIVAVVTLFGDLLSKTAYAGSSFLSAEELRTLLTGNTEIWTKGGAYYAPDGKLRVLWKYEYSDGRWKVINRNSRGMLCKQIGMQPRTCDHSYKKSGDKITIHLRSKSWPFYYLNGNQLAQLKSGVSYSQLKQREDAVRLLAQKKTEEEAARQLAKKKAEEEHARQLAKKKAEEEAAKLAQAELKRKQEATAAVDSSVEVEFWKSIKDDDDPDMYREYLRQFPGGVYAGLAKLKIKKLGGSDTSTVAKSSIPNLDYGDYYALVIGNNRYVHLSDLRTAVSDARSVANLLEVDYHFNVSLLENADRSQIVKSIAELRRKVSHKDNLLIYYAGHGYLDDAAGEGFWLPTDASPDDPSNWIATDRVVGQIRAMEAKHVMIVADSCFSGAITRGLKIEQRTPAWFEKMVKKKARTALTSGGLEPVMDAGSGGQHSVFAESFLSVLRDNDGVLDASQLYSQLRPKVMVNSDQTPEYGDIHRAGHDGGDFLFVRQ